jgi:hypothetical protein
MVLSSDCNLGKYEKGSQRNRRSGENGRHHCKYMISSAAEIGAVVADKMEQMAWEGEEGDFLQKNWRACEGREVEGKLRVEIIRG